MKKRTPIARDQRSALPAFDPVPRKPRHDGWTPERQRAFVEALADTGSVETACRTVNMSSVGAYHLRRQPGADGFRRAWAAALDMGVERLRDEAFERALNGQLVPVFSGGKLMGFRRQKNDRLLMFILRHHGRDAQGRRVTVNMFNTTTTVTAATSAHGAGGDPAPLPAAEEERAERRCEDPGARTRITRSSHAVALPDTRPDPAETVAAFPGVALDDEAQAQIAAILERCAARQRALAPEDDPAVSYIDAREAGTDYLGELESGMESDDAGERAPGEVPWQMLDRPDELDAIDVAVAAMKAAQARGEWDELGAPLPPAAPVKRDDHDLLNPPDLDWRTFGR